MGKILLTGNLGYIGTVLTHVLKERGYFVAGYDASYYEGFPTDDCRKADIQIIKDIRNADSSDVKGFDAVIHLAALSNDPLGEFDPGLTEEINFNATVRLAEMAKTAGVQRFVYASSQSMYGISSSDEELDEDNSVKNPVTVYAKTKWAAEKRIKTLSSGKFSVVCFRPSTVFGASPKFRCDIVFNNLVACAYATGKIVIKSDGTPWRPVVHVRDVCKAFIAGIEAPSSMVSGQSFNVGIPGGNYTVKDLAEAAARAVPGCELVFTGEHADSRTYRVGFARILCLLKDYYRPEWDLEKGGQELFSFFKKINLTEKDFKGRMTNRLMQLKHLLDTKAITERFYINNK